MQVKASLSCLAAVLLMAGCNGGSGTLSDMDEMVDVPVMEDPDSPDDGDEPDGDTGDTPDEDLPQIGDLPGGPSSPGGDSTTQRQPVASGGFGTFGAWNQQVAQVHRTAVCDPLCGPPDEKDKNKKKQERFDDPPMALSPLVSPYGSTAQFSTTTDDWTAEWRGPFQGVTSSGDPDPWLKTYNDCQGGDAAQCANLPHNYNGPYLGRFAGQMRVWIESTGLDKVNLRYEKTRYLNEAGEPGGLLYRDGNKPGAPDWIATLSTTAGEKGFFTLKTDDDPHSKNMDRHEKTILWGQFNDPGTGGTPTGVIGHIHDNAFVATFVAKKTDD